jgi:hypothetical protein
MNARILGITAWVWLCALCFVTAAEAHVTVGPLPSEARGLLDGRAYEMVSPPQKDGAQIIPTREEGGLIEASEDGDAIAYLANAPIEPNPPANPSATQVFSKRTPTGWSSKDISTPGEAAIRVGTGLSYQAFSADLSTAIVEPHQDILSLAPEVPSELTTPTSIETYSYDMQGGGYRPLVTTGNSLPTQLSGERAKITFEGASKDAEHAVFSSELALTPGALEEQSNLYEWTDGALKLASVLPDESPTSGGELGGGVAGEINSVSEDGSRVIWSIRNQALYTRDTATERTTEVDDSRGGSGSSGGGAFRTASSDGVRIFFTDEKELTSDADAGNDLYEFNSSTGGLVDLTPDTGDPQGAQVGSVFGASEDGSYVYFLARGALAQGAIAGHSNLYVAHDDGTKWSTSFIAVLAQGGERIARVSPNGHFLAFMSSEPLTGYDNRDIATGLRDQEVYLFSAESELLTCASCNPTGERPAGEIVPEQPEIDSIAIWWQQPVAALIPPVTSRTLSGNYAYQPRYLTDQGQLFFDSVDSLVLHDTNGQPDVYEYEPAGSGSCGASGGCVSLVSSGLDSEESAFMDASASGDDVFFLTRDRLSTEDFDSSFDMYDAHVCSLASPCAAPPPSSPPPCDTGDACKAAPTPQPSVFGDPASATFVGATNVTPTPQPVETKAKSKSKRKPKSKKRQKLKEKLKSKHKQTVKRRRHGSGGAKKSDRRVIR